MNEIYHIPAMLRETIQGLNIQPNGLYVDVTFGGGGHSRAILEAIRRRAPQNATSVSGDPAWARGERRGYRPRIFLLDTDCATRRFCPIHRYLLCVPRATEPLVWREVAPLCRVLLYGAAHGVLHALSDCF